MDALRFIEALGGTAAVAELADVRAPSVSGWKSAERIPQDRLIRLAVIAEQRGIATRFELFPADWHLIWPELISAEGAPAVPTAEPVRAGE